MNTSSILYLIKESIAFGNIIDKEEVKQMLDGAEIPNDFELLIDACNDLICSNYSANESVNNSYSCIQNENTTLKDELASLRKEVLELKTRVTGLEEENNSLKETNDSSTQKLKILTNAFESIK